MAEKLAPEKRHKFFHGSQKVFEWDQTLEEVNMYINLPPNVFSKLFYCKILAKHVEVGIKGNPPYLNHDLYSHVKTDSSFWTIEDDILHVTLQKRDKGQTWPSPIQGQGQLDPMAADIEQKRLMLQRFQEENPGFDFSQAQFSGNCPDPRTLMGGIKDETFRRAGLVKPSRKLSLAISNDAGGNQGPRLGRKTFIPANQPAWVTEQYTLLDFIQIPEYYS